MTDREYDALYDELVALESETGIVLSNSPTQNVGYEVLGSLTKIRHPQRIVYPLTRQRKYPVLLNFWATM